MDAQTRALQRVGQTLDGKWLLEKLLGCGGMAAVYAATHRNGKRAAIKVLHPELSVHTDFRQRFLREGYLANTVEHAGAVSVLDDAVADESTVYLVMELLTGETLGARWEREGKHMSVQAVLPIADAVLDVLGAAHAKGIVHRDVKPDNIFLTEDGRVKLLDFGVARMREATSVQATASGMTMGTPSFMPPEQARGRWREIDARADVWAVGATVWTCLTGRFVHRAETGNEVLLMAMTATAPRFASIAPSAPGLARLLDRALEYDREKRFPSAAAMQAELREVLASIAGAPTVTVSIDPGMSDPMAPTMLEDSSPEARGGLATRTLIGTTASSKLLVTKGRRRAARWVGAGVAAGACATIVLALRMRPGASSATTAAPTDAGETHAVAPLITMEPTSIPGAAPPATHERIGSPLGEARPRRPRFPHIPPRLTLWPRLAPPRRAPSPPTAPASVNPYDLRQ